MRGVPLGLIATAPMESLLLSGDAIAAFPP